MTGGYAAWAGLAAVAAGAAGAVLRWAVVSWLHAALSRRAGSADPFPLGVLVANTVASLVAGIAVPTAANLGPAWRLVVVAGLCGGLSTLSTLAVDTVALWQRGRRPAAAVNVAANVALGSAAAWVGAAVIGGRLADVLAG